MDGRKRSALSRQDVALAKEHMPSKLKSKTYHLAAVVAVAACLDKAVLRVKAPLASMPGAPGHLFTAQTSSKSR